MKPLLGALALLSGMASLAGCSSVKVDCEKMCTRAFKDCISEVVVAAKKGTVESQKAVEKAGQLPKMQEAGYASCMKSCKKSKGMGSDAGEINTCLAKAQCQEFAECIKPYLK